MYGAIIGDIVGSVYEGSCFKSKIFPFFSKYSRYTDDTVMTCAVAAALLERNGIYNNEEKCKNLFVKYMRKYGQEYYDAGYGGSFKLWLSSKTPEPYKSFGNGSAMRVSPVAWVFNDIETVKKLARWSAEVTHNHPEGIKGAEATAVAVFLARTGKSKDAIELYIRDNYYPELKSKIDGIRHDFIFNESCQYNVPPAISCFLQGENFEDVIRLAISLGGDTDTNAAIAGGIAEAYYGIPEQMIHKIKNGRIPDDLVKIADEFENTFGNKIEKSSFIDKTKYLLKLLT